MVERVAGYGMRPLAQSFPPPYLARFLSVLCFFMNGSITLPVLMICLIVPLGFTGPLMKVSEAMEQVSMIKGNLEQVTTFLKTPELQRPADPVTLTEPTFEF